VLLVLALLAAAQPTETIHHTFSIAAVDPETGEVGVAVTTRNPCVGNGVPWVRAGVGAVATQARTRTQYGEELLDLLEDGRTPDEALRERGRRAASIHPMFGPDAHVLHGCHVLVMDLGDEAAAEEAARVFGGTMAEVLHLPLADHDPLIAYVLGLSHALNLAFLRALTESGEEIPTLARISSVTFNRQLQVAAAVAGENPHLYYEIQHENPHGERALAALTEAVTKVREAVDGDEPAFVGIMEKGLEYLKNRPR